MEIPDPIEQGEARAEAAADGCDRGDKFACAKCGGEFPWAQAWPFREDPYSPPVCRGCVGVDMLSEDAVERHTEWLRLCNELLSRIKLNLSALEKALADANDKWCYEDGMYRFYHQSRKVYHRFNTKPMVDLLASLAPEGVSAPASGFFKEILSDGIGQAFDESHNQEWTRHTRPIVEAFLHARYFLEMAAKYGRELERAPEMMPSGWAALLCFYGLR